MTVLRFKLKDVLKLYNDAKEDKEHEPSFTDLYNSEYLKEGEAIEHGERATLEQIDKSKIPAALKLVKDNGIYLMSNSVSSNKKGLEENGECPLVYAEGFNPEEDDVYDKCRYAVGGDDFAEGFPLDWVDILLEDKPRARLFKIGMSKTEMRLVL